jgi:hypothetical protein
MAGRGGLKRTSFAPGRSGNPGGRPKGLKDIEALARKHAPEAIAALVAALSGKDRVHAAAVLLDRGYGKARQFVEIEAAQTLRFISDKPMTEEEWLAEYGHKDEPAAE